MTATNTRAWRHPWQVVRVHEGDGTTVPIASFRTQNQAALFSGARDMASIIVRRGATPGWHYDVRRTPGRVPAYRFCIHCDANTSGPGPHIHTDTCPRHPAAQGA